MAGGKHAQYTTKYNSGSEFWCSPPHATATYTVAESAAATRVCLQIQGMHTIIRDVKTPKNDFTFFADRLNRLVSGWHGVGTGIEIMECK